MCTSTNHTMLGILTIDNHLESSFRLYSFLILDFQGRTPSHIWLQLIQEAAKG